MDFVAKKALQAKVKRFGDDLGVNEFFSSSGGNGTSSSSTGNILNTATNTDTNSRTGSSTEELFPSSLASHFDGQAGNFPTLCYCLSLNMFWIDRSILSARADACMLWAHRLLFTIVTLSLFNVVTRTLSTALLPGVFPWAFIIVSVAACLILSGAQVVMYDTAFRGLYRSSVRLRRRYMGMCAVTAAVAATYAFAGGGWFNGWTRLGMFSNDGGRPFEGQKGYKRSVLLVCNVCESIGWTFGFGLAVFTLFEMFHVYRERVKGLSEQAERDARRGRRPAGDEEDDGGGRRDDEEEGGGGGNGGGGAGRDPRITAIREKYGMRG